MSLVATQMNANTPVDQGSVLQCYLLPASISLAQSIAASGNVVSAIIITSGYKYFNFACKSTQGGSVSIQRYLDQAATIPVGAAITGSISANTAMNVDSVDNIPYQSFIITVSNSGGSTATLSNCALLLQSS
jgi:tryptophanase